MAGTGEKLTARAGGVPYGITVGRGVLDDVAGEAGRIGADKTALFVSSRVNRLHGEYILRTAEKIGKYEIVELEDGEDRKSFAQAGRFLERLLMGGYTRSSLIIAIGGGVVGDFAGFIASVFMRGIPFIQVPTTLLAMVDASIGGKVAVNLSAGKNIVGSFHQPLAVFADIRFLETLPDRQMKNGMAEVLKHGIIGDAGTLEILERGADAPLRDYGMLGDLILRSAAFKSSVVERDERESGLRKILNFGHTVGHAIESSMDYRNILHGEAVAIGMFVKLAILRDAGRITAEEHGKLVPLLRRYCLPDEDFDFDTDDVIRHMNFDKKNRDGRVLFVLLDGIGRPAVDGTVDRELLRSGLEGYRAMKKGGDLQL